MRSVNNPRKPCGAVATLAGALSRRLPPGGFLGHRLRQHQEAPGGSPGGIYRERRRAHAAAAMPMAARAIAPGSGTTTRMPSPASNVND